MTLSSTTANLDKCHFLIGLNNEISITVEIAFASYADYKTPYNREHLIKKLIQELENNKNSPPSGLVIIN